jgi:predicted transcriptional regulator
MRRFLKVFRPQEKGIRRILGDLEAEIMEALWDAGTLTGRELYRRILRRGRKRALTSVLTVLGRLRAKGLVSRERRGGVFVYRPRVGRRELLDQAAGLILEGLLETDEMGVVSTFVEKVARDHPAALERLRALLERGSGGEAE